MMKDSSILRLARKSNSGLTELGGVLGVAHCTPAALSALYDGAVSKNAIYQSAKSGKAVAQDVLEEARTSALDFLERGREFLKPRLGSSWRMEWAEAGFNGPTLEIPKEDEGRANVLLLLKGYFTTHPTHESTEYIITALEAQTRLDAFLTAIQGTVNCRQDQRAKREARDASMAALFKKLRCLWSELEALLEPLDNRWLKFIDRIPGDPRVPEQVEDVTASAQPGGIITLDWEDTTRAASYKVFKQVVGVDAAPVLFTTVDDSAAQLTGLPTGAMVKLQIVATNSVGDAAASEVIQLQAA